MRILSISIFVAVASVGLCAGPKQPKGDKAALNGRWVPDSAVMAGEAFPDDVRKSIRLVLFNGKYTATVGEAVDEGTYEIDETANPKTITIVGSRGPNKGKTIMGIYEFDKGKLRICYDLSGKAFPAKFESKPDTQSFLASYQRQKTTRGEFKSGND